MDFLTYPYFTRYGNMNFNQYCFYAETKFLHSGLTGSDLCDLVKDIELKNSSDFFVRVFVDEVDHKVFVMGVMDRFSLFESPFLKKMVLPGKSEVPLYFVKKIKYGRALGGMRKKI